MFQSLRDKNLATIFLSIITKPYNCETDNPPFFSGRATEK